MNCHNCKFALLRSASPGKHYVYECCELGLIFAPQLPATDHDCRDWQQGVEREPMGVELIYGSDIEL